MDDPRGFSIQVMDDDLAVVLRSGRLCLRVTGRGGEAGQDDERGESLPGPHLHRS
jgi:hypothetical protein